MKDKVIAILKSRIEECDAYIQENTELLETRPDFTTYEYEDIKRSIEEEENKITLLENLIYEIKNLDE